MTITPEDCARLRELLAASEVPPLWAVCGAAAPNPYWIGAQTIGAADDLDARRVGDIWHPNNAQLVATAINALPALLQIAEAYFSAPPGGVEWDGGVRIVNFIEDDEPNWDEGQLVRIVPVVAQGGLPPEQQRNHD